ncbi:MAG: tRNA (adenosine(37)-N6)-threonylcarbamoyltransferase complex dimerization subunit type 1 TsaB [Clostridia bacterium]|nr:tRNA (adenosine(37)-N6)-threonylcarbamoyltransferase complex dimerization subunit type 1 TsaB [Clostridia bacterium]
MKYLAIDTSNDYLTVVLNTGERIETYFSADGRVKHSLTLMPAVESLCEKTGFSLSGVDFFCAVVGPGSFTGIRIGVAAVNGFADAFSKPVLGVTAFDALSYNDSVGKRLAVIDAAHGNCYRCGYDNDAVCLAPAISDIGSVKDLAKDYRIISYSEVKNLDTEKVDPVKGLINAIEKLNKNVSSNVDSLVPFYLRLSQAEEGRS